MLFALKRSLMPWTMLVVGSLPLLALLFALPPQFTGSPAFTLLLVATYFAAGARFYVKKLQPRTARGALALPFVLVVFALVDVGVLVHLELPFWKIGDNSLAAKSLDPPPPADHTLYIVEHGWHTGLVIETRDLVRTDLAYFEALQNHRFVEVGWGDAEFFQADDPTPAMAADAMLTPGPAVVHLAEFDAPVESFFKGEKVYRLAVSAAGTAALSRFVAQAIDTSSGAPRGTSPGFLAATGSYYFPHTCNVWTANALEQAGVDVTPMLAVTSRSLMHQVRRVGTLVHSDSEPPKSP